MADPQRPSSIRRSRRRSARRSAARATPGLRCSSGATPRAPTPTSPTRSTPRARTATGHLPLGQIEQPRRGVHAGCDVVHHGEDDPHRCDGVGVDDAIHGPCYDLCCAANTTARMDFLTTLTPAVAGAQTLSATYALPAGALQAVRARFRYQGKRLSLHARRLQRPRRPRLRRAVGQAERARAGSPDRRAGLSQSVREAPPVRFRRRAARGGPGKQGLRRLSLALQGFLPGPGAERPQPEPGARAGTAEGLRHPRLRGDARPGPSPLATKFAALAREADE